MVNNSSSTSGKTEQLMTRIGGDNQTNFEFNCVTQLKPYTLYKLSCSIFCCHWVSLSGIGNTRPNLRCFQYIQACKPFADPVPPKTKQFQLILTKYQPVSSYTDPVPSSTTYNWSSCMAQFSQLNNFSFYGSFDKSRTVQNTWSCCDVNLMQNCFKNGEINTTIVNLVSVKKNCRIYEYDKISLQIWFKSPHRTITLSPEMGEPTTALPQNLFLPNISLITKVFIPFFYSHKILALVVF